MPLRKEIKKVLVIGSGPIVIGQAAEFDYAGTQACLALKEEGIEVVLVNSNPATIMTDSSIADRIYLEPLTVEVLERIIIKEKPDGIIGTLGGQTGLNLTVQLEEQGILETYGVTLLGTSVESIKKGEDRDLFRSLMLEIGEPIPESKIVHDYEEGRSFVEQIGYPVIIRPAYTLGGEGGGFAHNEEELHYVLNRGLKLSPIHQVLVEKSVQGWKEIEYEVMRDANGTCIIVCNMENVDPIGVHTGDSIVVAPSQTLTDEQYQLLRDASLNVIRSLDIIGGCNIQFALDSHSNLYNIIEVNPRVSRSSALASKATGYPIARMAAKCAIGYQLDELLNPITGKTYASFEPALDYVVVKLPRFPFDKFTEADRTLSTQMKATGEVMAIDRSFEGALNKGIRSLELQSKDLLHAHVEAYDQQNLEHDLQQPTDMRLFVVAEALRRGMSIDEIYEHTKIDHWFLTKIEHIVQVELQLREQKWETISEELLKKAKRLNIADRTIAKALNVHERDVRNRLHILGWNPGYKQVDTCAGEFEAETPYYYSSWLGEDEAEVSANKHQKKVLVIGSGPIRIGQGIEFDYCSVHAAIALKELGIQAIVMNNNPETVSTDYSFADRLYFEPLTAEDILHVINKEKVEGVLIQFGGQTALNVAQALKEEGVTILGTPLEAMDQLEDREKFDRLLARLNIPRIAGESIHSISALKQAAKRIGYPLLVRPSYVIGGASMYLFQKEDELDAYIEHLQHAEDERMWPLLIDAYVSGMECELDAVCDGENVLVPGICEHLERAGTHSGDSLAIFPSRSLTTEQKNQMIEYTENIVRTLQISGMMNIQFIVQQDRIFVLEVNPRASRTVPIMSKVTLTPMIKWATAIQLGNTLEQLTERKGLLPEPNFITVKAPVFSFHKLNGVDPILGPEMKSTGEVIGLGQTGQEVLQKALKTYIPTDSIEQEDDKHKESVRPAMLFSVAGLMKAEALEMIKMVQQHGYFVIATPGTADFCKQNGMGHIQVIEKDMDQIIAALKSSSIVAIMNIPQQGRREGTFGYRLRQEALKLQIPCFTTFDTLGAYLEGKKDKVDQCRWQIGSLQEYQHEQYIQEERMTIDAPFVSKK